MLLKRLLIFLSLIFTFDFSYSQPNDLFNSFLDLFPKNQRINSEFQEKILNIEGPFSEARSKYESRHAKEILRETDSYILVTVKYSCGAGGICEGVDLYSFSLNGKLISTIELSEGFGDCGFMDKILLMMLNDNTIITKTHKWKGDCLEETTTAESMTMSEYSIEASGEIAVNRIQKINLIREYHCTSTDLLKEKDLLDKDKSELAMMRNELFASYGYIFKTEKWREHFSAQSWYRPIKEEVLEKDLTIIEQQNLALIKILESR